MRTHELLKGFVSRELTEGITDDKLFIRGNKLHYRSTKCVIAAYKGKYLFLNSKPKIYVAKSLEIQRILKLIVNNDYMLQSLNQ